MARRPPTLTSSSSMGDENTPRRSSNDIPNPNVFSDDYAVDPADFAFDLRPTESIDSIDNRPEELSVDRNSNLRGHPREYLPSGLPGHRLSLNFPFLSNRQSTADQSADPHRAVSTSSRSMADSRRTLSTSSRFSIPRSQSPYRGPTAPSQPYGMYTQMTRASSIASESTIRPTERPLPNGGPEHPYSMYPQNTVPEEDITDTHVALGFPLLGSSSSGDEVGDIVGSDGHVEQLPPYSRYADNVIAKGDMASLGHHAVSPSQDSRSATLVPPTAATSASDLELTAVGAGASTDEVARKEGLAQKRLRRICCGLPVWTWIILMVVVCLATVLGGVIGGVVGNQKGVQRAAASAASATTTIWLDADPASTGPTTPPCPTGHWTIPLNQTDQIDTCVVDPVFSSVWDCMNKAKLGISVFENTDGDGPPVSVSFDDYSLRPQLFRYGPQPPDFNGSSFGLKPFKDKDDDELGVALFFSTLFDKIVIFPNDAISLPAAGTKRSKRSVSITQLSKRDDGNAGDPDWMSTYLEVGQTPWFCFWNSTISEFWIFLGQDMDNNTSSASTTAASSMQTGPPPQSSSAAYSGPYGSPMYTPPATQSSQDPPSQTTSAPSEKSSDGFWDGSKVRRRSSSSSSNFPKLVKMVQKRKPGSNVQPYCQQMQVLNNWQIMPIPDVPTVTIQEDEYASQPTSAARMAIRPRADMTEQLGSNCICEWFSV
ncbi:hypothetical protein LTR99_010921 [Exophiala xenobiotica]|uniref:DUF7820 domain-containing protein n=1 Tax=Vermiconidia calcicola TaxID=1690605 RepID=A0AAV9PT15_9PEZI|nr:hypothetical protein H2202_010533 [Exophiala xenobiotica]KAK5527966.1 hypothetical protein LTR25_010765 [Vermiconidia calcicola]KAK5529322.1 hypothetical protein LTR23_010756 [Chaetothyriales sp. CCFEE 6169]KAK5203451.1 hypothetical protein LTR41_010814 [Exophiala xenobiotica]KAK5216633.1 hypothetical protein LTR72_010301 [Exophiala xenobiotica]